MMKDMRTSILLKIVSNVFQSRLNNTSAEIELTAAQINILGFLYHHKDEKINPIDIEKKFNLKRPTVTGILKRLGEKGFIEIKTDTQDKRYKQVLLTEKSNIVQEQMMKNLEEQEEILYANLTDKDKDELKRILNIMFKNITE